MTLNDIITQLGRKFGRNPATDTEFIAECTDTVNQILKELSRTAWWFWLSERERTVILDQEILYLTNDMGRIEHMTDSEDNVYGDRGYDRLQNYKQTINGAGNRTFAIGPTVSTVLYATGTVAVTNGSATVTGTGTTFTTAMIGSVFQKAGDNIQYTVIGVPDPTTLTLSKAYEETTTTGSSYELNPIGTKTISFLPDIEEDGTLTLTYYRVPKTLVAVADVPDLPVEYRSYLLWKARMRMLNTDEERNTLYQQAALESSEVMQMMQTDNAKTIQPRNPKLVASA